MTETLLTTDELRALPEDEEIMGHSPCVYFLWGGQDLLYIGATIQRNTRIIRHWREQRYGYSSSGIGKRIPFDRVTYLDCERADMWELEHAYQVEHQPPFNSVGPRARVF